MIKEYKQSLAGWVPNWISGLTHFRQYTKFGVVGLIATAVHISIFTFLIERFQVEPLTANVAAFCVAVFASYLGNFHWTFKVNSEAGTRQRSANTFAKFVVVAITGLILNSLAVYLTINVFGLPYGYAITLMLSVVPVIVFTLSRLWAFRPGRDIPA